MGKNEMIETNKYNNMLDAFECDFVLSRDCGKDFCNLDFNSDRLKKDINLLEELSFLLRHGKAKIMVESEE